METIKIAASTLIPAIKNVNLFACTDVTLPAICGVCIDYAPGKVTVYATDRYTLASQEVECDFDGTPGRIFLDAATVKMLASVKPGAYEAPTVILIREDDFTIERPDGFTITRPIMDTKGGSFPRLDALIKSMADKMAGQDDKEATTSARMAFDPNFLARFAKIRPLAKREPVIFTHPEGIANGGASRATCGPVTVFICAIRIPA